MGEELDLMRYIRALLRWWWLVAGLAALSIVAAVVTLRFMPRTHTAHALVVVSRERTALSLSPDIRSLSEDDMRVAYDARQRLATYVQLVSNPLVADSVLQRIQAELPHDLRSREALLENVVGGQAEASDAIEISVTSQDPHTAVLLAGTWAEEYVKHLNLLYGGTSEEAVAALGAQIDASQQAYEEAQEALQALARQDRVDELNVQINAALTVLQSLSVARNQQVQYVLVEMQRVERLEQAAEDLRAHLREGGTSARITGQVALALLKAQAYAMDLPSTAQLVNYPASERQGVHPLGGPTDSSGASLAPMTAAQAQLPASVALQLEVDTQSLTEDEFDQDLSALARVLKSRRQALGQELTVLLADAAGQSSQADALSRDVEAQRLVADLRALRAQLVAEKGLLSEATTRRDLAWETYSKLLRRQAELNIAANLSDAQVRLAIPGTLVRKNGSRTLRTAALAGIGGLVMGFAAVAVLELVAGARAGRRSSSLADEA